MARGHTKKSNSMLNFSKKSVIEHAQGRNATGTLNVAAVAHLCLYLHLPGAIHRRQVDDNNPMVCLRDSCYFGNCKHYLSFLYIVFVLYELF